ncbi:MAG: alpha-hydroxy-acid oxidizing protein [Firmicutes bacterium]|nr:alpha-hydroxy-acid oxidizing protein [Bacillota bacterium]
MDLKTIRREAREKLKGYCRVCPACDGRACSGEVPGMGGVGTGSGFRANLEALADYRLHMRTLHAAVEPDTGLKLFGLTLDTPVLAAPMTGTPYNMGGPLTEREFAGAIVSGSVAAGSLGFTGDGADPQMYEAGIDAVSEAGGRGVPVIKPREQEEVRQRVQRAEKSGAVALGMDVDGAGLVTMALKGQPVGPKTPAQMGDIISSTKLPFIVKGIMTVDEARMAVDAGAAAIVVSNHGGRVLDFTPGAAEVLPAITEEVKGSAVILADGGARTGVDVLKLLALGADAVLVGRPLVVGACGAGARGVQFILEKMTAELKQAMILTGCRNLAGVTPRVLAG